MNEVFMLVKKLYKDSCDGINKVVMNRSSSLANRGYNATILTVANFDVHETNKVLIKANKMNKKVKHINLYDYYSKINTKSNISRKQKKYRSEEHTSELQSRFDLVCRLLLEK